MRDDFYTALSEFASCLKVALQSATFFEDTSFSDMDRQHYKETLKQFSSLRQLVKQDAGETIDYDQYGEPQKLLKKTPECAELGINYQKISDAAIDDKTLPYKISEKINGYNNKIIKLKLIQKASEKKQLTSDELLEIYFDTSKSLRRKFLDRDLSDEEIAKITGHQNFKRFLKWVTFDREAKNLSKSLAKIDCSRTEDPDALFLLGLLKIKTSNTQAGCFKKSALMSKKQADKDRGFFWEYLADGNTDTSNIYASA